MKAEHGLLDSSAGSTVVDALRESLDQWMVSRWAVSYVSRSGVEAIRPALERFLKRGGRLRIVTTGDRFVTEPDALDRLMDLGVRDILFQAPGEGDPFHGKMYLFGERTDDSRRLIVGVCKPDWERIGGERGVGASSRWFRGSNGYLSGCGVRVRPVPDGREWLLSADSRAS